MAPVVEPPQDSQIMPSLEVPPTLVVPTTPQEAVVETMPTTPSPPPPVPARPSSKPPQVPRPVTPTVPESELGDSVSQAAEVDDPPKREGYWKLLILNKECKILNISRHVFDDCLCLAFREYEWLFTSRLYRYFKPKGGKVKASAEAMKLWETKEGRSLAAFMAVSHDSISHCVYLQFGVCSSNKSVTFFMLENSKVQN